MDPFKAEQRRLEKSLAPKCRADFIRVAGITPETFLDMATEGLPPLDLREVKYEDPAVDFFTVEYHGDGFQQKHTIDFNTGHLDAGVIESRRRDRGLGRRIFALCAMTGLYFGLKHMDVSASLEMGGYVWARAGVHINADSKGDLRRFMRERLAAIKDQLDPTTYASVFGLTTLRRNDDLQSIAALPQVVKNAETIWDQLRAGLLQPGAPYEVYVANGYLKDGQMTLGQFLLCGSEYDGDINLRDRRQMDQFERYTGVNIRAMARENIKRYPRKGVS